MQSEARGGREKGAGGVQIILTLFPRPVTILCIYLEACCLRTTAYAMQATTCTYILPQLDLWSIQVLDFYIHVALREVPLNPRMCSDVTTTVMCGVISIGTSQHTSKPWWRIWHRLIAHIAVRDCYTGTAVSSSHLECFLKFYICYFKSIRNFEQAQFVQTEHTGYLI